MSNSDWITIREAVEISKKPEITIRRLVKRLVADKSMTNQNVKSDKSGSSQKYLIRRQYIQKIYGLKDDSEVTSQVIGHDKSDDISSDKSMTSHDLVDILKNELTEKNKQIEKLQDALKNQQVLNLEMTRYLDKIALPVAEPQDIVQNQNSSVQAEQQKTKRWWLF